MFSRLEDFVNIKLFYRHLVICLRAILLSLLLYLGSMGPSYAQMSPFDYRGDSSRVPGDIQLNFSTGDYEIQKSEYKDLDTTQAGNIIRMEGFNTTTSPGDPILPVQIYDVAVPPNIDWETLELSVKPRQTVTLSGTYDLLPAPPLRARIGDQELVDWGEGKDIVDGRNLNVYSKDRFFPEETLKIASRSQMRKWKFLRLEFTPVQYNPVQQSLRLVKSVQVRLNFKRIGTTAFRSNPLLADTFMDEEARERFINFEEASEWYNYVPRTSGKSAEDPDFVIVTTNDIRDDSTELGDFVTHKQALGYTVRVVTEDDYGALPPSSKAEKIRQWLSENYISLGIHYVLLIGNPDPDDGTDSGDAVGDLPMQMGWPRYHYPKGDFPTDYFYADLTGNWDLDGDGFFGESISITHATSPDLTIDSDTFSVLWMGRIEADVDGNYRFRTDSDNGIRLTLDGTTVIDNWTSHLATQDEGTLRLTAGQHDIQLEYYDETGDGLVRLSWQPPGESAYQIVPSNKLYHEVGGSYDSGGLEGEYFNNTDFTAPALIRLDANINFFWGTGDRGVGGVDFEPDVYVGRIPVYGGDYAILDAILRKTIDYETSGDTAWRRKWLAANVNLAPGRSDCEFTEHLKENVADPLGFATYRIYEPDCPSLSPPECPNINPRNTDVAADCNLLGEWANGGGYGLVTWRTHGGETRASHLMNSADNRHLDDTHPAFTFQGSCGNGWPENDNNLGYALLEQGAIGTVSASRVSWRGRAFDPSTGPNPLSGGNPNLLYHYVMRLMQGDSAGHALYITKRNVNPNGYWPNKMDYNLYGDPSVRLSSAARGLALLFDTSGSMSWSHAGEVGVPESEQRLSLAKEATYPFIELLTDHADRQINFGISTFPPHPWSSTVGCNGQEVTPMTRLDEASKDTAMTETIPGLVAEGDTPLLAGLMTAAGMFGTETGGRAIVLLSDGYHNCPSSVDSSEPAVNTLIDLLNANSIKVYTIGFGRPTDIDHSLLKRLAEDTGGRFYDVTNPAFDPATWSPATDLQATYKAILVDTLGLETITDPLGTLNAGNQITTKARISEADRRVSFFLSWKTPQTGRLGLKVKSADEREVPINVTTPGVSFHEGKTYKILTLDRDFLSQAGKVGAKPWTLEIDTDGLQQGEREDYQYSVIVDSELKMETLVRPEAQWAGDTFTLTTKITAAGQPVTGLSDVSVQVSRPREGLGNWFVANEVSAEELQQVPIKIEGESLSPVLRKALYLTDIRKVALPRRTPTEELLLYDDGSHGDVKAGDGTYTNRFRDTAKEGTYTFHFQAKGQTEEGSTFERDEIAQRYLKVKVSPENTLVKVERLTIPDSKLLRFRVVLTPRDALGNFLGPRSAKAIQLSSTQGNYLGTLQDNLNGSYSQVLKLPVEANLKQVVVGAAILGTNLSLKLSQVLLEEGGVTIQWLWFAIVILLIAIMGLILWILMMRQRLSE